MDRVEYQAFVKEIEQDPKRWRSDLIAFIRRHDNYPQWMERKQTSWLKPVKALRDKPLAKMSMFELVFLATWISGPAYLIDELSR